MRTVHVAYQRGSVETQAGGRVVGSGRKTHIFLISLMASGRSLDNAGRDDRIVTQFPKDATFFRHSRGPRAVS